MYRSHDFINPDHFLAPTRLRGQAYRWRDFLKFLLEAVADQDFWGDDE